MPEVEGRTKDTNPKTEVCQTCGGTGKKDGESCPNCRGTGQTVKTWRNHE